MIELDTRSLLVFLAFLSLLMYLGNYVCLLCSFQLSAESERDAVTPKERFVDCPRSGLTEVSFS